MTSEQPSKKPNIGDKAPDFTLQDMEGKIHSLSDFSGQTVVVYFYPKDNTPGCTTEACDFRDNYNMITSAGATVIGISPDSIESHVKFANKYNLNFMLLADPDKKSLRDYNVLTKVEMCFLSNH